MPENKLEEIVRGESRIMPPPSRGHAFLIRRLAHVLEAQLDASRITVVSTPFGLGISREPVMHCRIPDLAVFEAAVLAREADPHYIWVTPELVVECLSPANRKGSVQELLDDYAGIGVPEVWFLYPEQPAAEIYLHAGGGLRQARRLEQGQLSGSRLPQAGVDLDGLWAAFRGRL